MRGSILPPKEQECPVEMSDIIQECMARDPDERPSAKDIFLYVPRPTAAPAPSWLPLHAC